MNDLANRRYTEQLNKEKWGRRAWATHGKSQEVFDVASEEWGQLSTLKDTLETLCVEPSRTGVTDPHNPRPSRRKQLVQLRNELRTTIERVDKKLDEKDEEAHDPKMDTAVEEIKERSKRPPHLRGAQLLKETLGCA